MSKEDSIFVPQMFLGILMRSGGIGRIFNVRNDFFKVNRETVVDIL